MNQQTFIERRRADWDRLEALLGFARAVRRRWRFVLAAAACFYLPLLLMIALVQWQPQLAFSMLDEETARSVEAMYDPSRPQAVGRDPTRGADTDLTMFGYYIRNNTGIGFRSFAGGLLLPSGRSWSDTAPSSSMPSCSAEPPA